VAWPLEHWSPKGRYVLYIKNPWLSDSSICLLDVKSCNIKLTFGQPKSHLITFGTDGSAGVSWALDESKVFCLAEVIEKGEQAFLVETETNQIFDCTKESSKDFNEAPVLLPLWTTDGRCILANSYAGIGGCLIQPRPWKVVPIAKQLATRFNYNGPYWPVIFPLNISNWVGLNAPQLSKGKSGPPKYAIDYEGRESTFLFDDPGIFACSPNGKRAATIWINVKKSDPMDKGQQR
jgi:hypothetical protein